MILSVYTIESCVHYEPSSFLHTAALDAVDYFAELHLAVEGEGKVLKFVEGRENICYLDGLNMGVVSVVENIEYDSAGSYDTHQCVFWRSDRHCPAMGKDCVKPDF